MMKTDDLISIVFFFKAGQKKGLGNLYRCRSLALELRKYKNVKIIISAEDKKLFNIAFKGLSFNWLSSKKIFKSKNNDIIIVDITNYPLNLQKKLKNSCKYLVGIDDWGKGPFIYDFLLRPNPIKLPKPKMLQKNHKIYKGINYILLDSKFNKKNVKKYKKEIKNIFICFGGSDPKEYTARIIKIIIKENFLENIKFTVVVGSYFLKINQLKNLLINKKNFQLLQNPKNMIDLYKSCDVALISSGYLLYEACALGKPSLVLSQDNEQHNESKIFARKKAVLRPARGIYSDDQSITKIMKKLFFEKKLRHQLHVNSKRSISTKGSQLTALKIIKHYKEKINI
jgi:spore coat polysaccharide biosynthesis predicted glycosyltransferase SpsG